jgi:hypothetical protein
LQRGWFNGDVGREIGMIAGVKSLGLGRLTGQLGPHHDGTVSIEETMADFLTDRVELPVTHTGMLMSHEVAAQAANFLRTGRFKQPDLGLRRTS